ncbi:LOW QUALITY PROTEIN: MORC family CW-type zinc finger protein 1 [Hippopotamus amphibius kiboko]|uniref:LOW QUALITY PROTEIN: MORC family CW-type zinc finger protein 1 n=1 Tax=Hippopotamus amphibius kiboko TaxID=575201 RepID=UPI002599EBD1|nr:LOW QUALITY PROTEIN: MORC family CW-type zinc finger protein 1 [Hippopotamus amphibius kiboko]
MVTTHSFLFGALAELLDNARDSGAARLDVFSVDKEELQGGFMLCFLDDGCGMSPEEASDIIYFGTSKKRLSTLKFIGQYGNGLKSGSMRIGKDFILFTKKEETMTCVFFSQTFCEREGLSEVVVPIPSWLTRTRESVTDDPQKFSTELSIIYKYSPFKTEAELMQQFDVIYGKCGTLLVIYNLKLLLSGEPELDVKTDKEDILIAGALEDFPERRSFKAYTSVLYFDPWMRIFIQAKRVKTKYLCYCLYRPRKYLYVTSSFKGAFKNEVKKAEEAVNMAEFILKEAQIKVNHCDRTSWSSPATDILQKALEDVKAKQKTLQEKQRELKKARTLTLLFGVNIENLSQAGMFIYSNNRLIKMHEKVGPQLKLKSLLGAGVVGIVNVPLEIMEPSHNKQEFLNVQEYNHLLKVMGQYLVQYCKDTGISNRNLTLFWNEFGCQNNEDMEKSSDSIQYQRRLAMAIPFIIQCDLCLNWRVLPPSTNYQEKEFSDIWICANNPNLLENSCHQTQRLPSIPLGTTSTVSPSKNEKDKQLQESVQRYQNQLAEPHRQPQFIPTSRLTELTITCQNSAPKGNMKIQRIRPSDDNLKHESLSSFELSVNHRGWKRNTEGSDSDVEYVSETKIVKKSIRKKVKPQQWRHPAILLENVKLAERSQAFSWEMKRKQRQNLVQECKALIEVETNNSNPDIIEILDESDTDVSLKQEKKEVPLMKKEKQELCSDTPEIKRNSSSPNRESMPVEDLNPCSGYKARVSVSGGCKVASSLTKPSQSTSVKETVRKLTSNLREILLYFLPECQLPSEFGQTSLEELITSYELEQCPEQTNKKLKMCFDQICDVYLVQYEKKLKRKMQSIICEANRRGVANEVSLGQCERKRKITEDKLNNLRVKLAALLQKLQLGGPAGDLEQIDSYLEALLKEDNLLLQKTLNKVTTDTGHCLLLEKKESTSQN